MRKENWLPALRMRRTGIAVALGSPVCNFVKVRRRNEDSLICQHLSSPIALYAQWWKLFPLLSIWWQQEESPCHLFFDSLAMQRQAEKACKPSPTPSTTMRLKWHSLDDFYQWLGGWLSRSWWHAFKIENDTGKPERPAKLCREFLGRLSLC